jgi:hypothetical protein
MERQMAQFYICDLRNEWRYKKYITFWRPNDAGYAFPLPWSGKYDQATVDAGGEYYTRKSGRRYIRFAVPCEAVEALAIDPAPGHIDGNVGPVVAHTAANRAALRAAMYLPQTLKAAA